MKLLCSIGCTQSTEWFMTSGRGKLLKLFYKYAQRCSYFKYNIYSIIKIENLDTTFVIIEVEKSSVIPSNTSEKYG
jgi:hypothetical protein